MMKIFQLLSASSNYSEMFDFQNNEMDYEDLSYQITILAAALTDIDRQVSVEREDKDAVTLETICTQIFTLHGKIGELQPVMKVALLMTHV